MPSQYVNLMPNDQNLGCHRGPRSEQLYQRRPDQAASFSHKIETLRDSASLASRIRFPTGTGTSSPGWSQRLARSTIREHDISESTAGNYGDSALNKWAGHMMKAIGAIRPTKSPPVECTV